MLLFLSMGSCSTPFASKMKFVGVSAVLYKLAELFNRRIGTKKSIKCRKIRSVALVSTKDQRNVCCRLRKWLQWISVLSVDLFLL